MELNKTHRTTLLEKLKEARKEEEHAHTAICRLGPIDEDRGADEIDHYLAKEKVLIITQALTENELDY